MKSVVAALLLLVVGACAPLIAEYNLEAYKNATSIKAEIGTLVDKSSRSYAESRKDVEVVVTKVNAAYEFAAGQPNNGLAAQQWQIIRDPNGAFLGRFLKVWRSEGTLGAGFRQEERKQFDAAFDQLICLEANKQAAKPCT